MKSDLCNNDDNKNVTEADINTTSAGEITELQT